MNTILKFYSQGLEQNKAGKTGHYNPVIGRVVFPATGHAGFENAHRLHAHAQTTSGDNQGYPAACRIPVKTDRNGEVSSSTPSTVHVTRRKV